MFVCFNFDFEILGFFGEGVSKGLEMLELLFLIVVFFYKVVVLFVDFVEFGVYLFFKVDKILLGF